MKQITWQDIKKNKRYTISTIFRQGCVLLVEKQKPAWQAGKFNLPGGHIEEGETPIQAANREVKEETGLDTISSYQAGRMVGTDWEIFIFNHICDFVKGYPKEVTDVGEKVLFKNVIDLKYLNIIENLKIIIPMCYAQVDSWTIRDNKDITGKPMYEVYW